MSSSPNNCSLRNTSLCVYIGNTSSLDDQSLVNYCSQFGTVVSCSIDNCPPAKRLFCDFRIVEFVSEQQRESFLRHSRHQIDALTLDVKCYRNLLDNFEILNIERKLFVGPISNPNDINTIIQFYKLIDSTLQHCLSRQDKQVHILIEFSSREYIRTVIQQQTIPTTIDNQIFSIHPAVHPKEFLPKTISARNSQNQLRIHGLTERITERMLIDYFDKRAPVVAYHILPNDPACAIIEFEYEKCVQKLLEMSTIRVHGTTLSLSRVPGYPTPAQPSPTSHDRQADIYPNKVIDHPARSGSVTPKSMHQSATPSPTPVQKTNVIPQQPASAFFPFREVARPPSTPSPEVSECGWTSPPRMIINHRPLDDPLPERVPSRSYQPMITETDVKPPKSLTNSIFHFVEQFQSELDRIKDEYTMKFTRDRTAIEHEFSRLMNDERVVLGRVDRYLYENRPRPYDNRRKYP